MSKFDILNNVTRTFHKVGFKLKKHSPEIMVVGGVIGVTAAAVMACKASTKINFVLEETKKKIDIIHEGVEKGEVLSKKEDGTEALVPYSEEDGAKDTAYVYAHTALDVAKMYGPAVVLGSLSIVSILAGHKILRTRNIALAAAYATVDSSFKEYRGRVIDRFGKELDKELKYDIKAKEVQETIVNEDGSESTVTKTINTANIGGHSEYAKFFDEYCTGWTKDPELNRRFLHMQEKYANQKLQAQGYLFLNEVYEMLGIDKTKAGHVVGWIYDEKNPIGDNYVDFGIYDIHDEAKRDFVNGRERSILLDFNVDGNIWEMM